MRSDEEDSFLIWSHGLRRSDTNAFEAVFDAMYDALFRYSLYITRDREASSDITQDVFVKLWQIRDTIDPERSLKSLLYQMARNYSLNHERQRKRHAADELTEDHPASGHHPLNDEILDADELGRRLNEWIEDMPDRRREAFMLSRYEGMSHEEIATLMNLAPKTVNNHIVLALQHLRQKVEAHNND